MEKVFILTDYLGRFESKYDDLPYRGGMNLSLITDNFSKNGFGVETLSFPEIKTQYKKLKGKPVIYTSSEDQGLNYKSFIEDIILFLELSGARVIPSHALLRCNNNKVMMELMREYLLEDYNSLYCSVFGAVEEFIQYNESAPLVIKESFGAQSRGVYLGENKYSMKKYANIVSNTFDLKDAFKNFVRFYKYQGYRKESQHRKKFIVQQFIPNLKHDFKVLIFGQRAYILKRGIKKNDFRASGSRWNYHIAKSAEPPDGIFDFCFNIKNSLNVPNVSLDIAFDGEKFYLIEFQCLYFGSFTQAKSDCYYVKSGDNYTPVYEKLTLEQVYVEAICVFLQTENQE